MPQAGGLGQLGRPERRLEHRLDHHVAGILGVCRPRVGVHELGQQGLVERAPVDPDANRLAVLDGGLDDGLEVLVVPLGADVAGVDAVLVERPRHGRVLDQQLVPVVVEVTDHRHADAEIADLAHHFGYGGGSSVGVDRHADQLRARVGQRGDLERGGVGVRGVGVGHRLDDDGVPTPDQDAADVHGGGLAPTWQMGQALDLDAVGEGAGHGAAPRRAMSKIVM